MSSKPYRPWDPRQPLLLAPDLRTWLPNDHLVWFILDLVEQLNLSPIEDVIQSKDRRGTHPHDPRMMLALLLYAYAVGVYSSRKIERATYEDVAFRVLTADQHPDHDTIATFRRTHLAAFQQLFEQSVAIAASLGLVRFGLLALDGSKIRARASKHKAMSYDRMNRALQRLQDEIAALMQRAEHTDQEEEARYGQGAMPDLPDELRRRQERSERIAGAKALLEEQARHARAAVLYERHQQQQARAADPTLDAVERKRSATRARQRKAKADALTGRSDDEPAPAPPGPTELPLHQVRHDAEGRPTAQAQRNFTDPDSRIMESHGQFVQAYNAQAVVDEGQLIVGQGVSNQAPDTGYLGPLVRGVRQLLGRLGLSTPAPIPIAADSGFWSPQNVEAAQQCGFDPYLSVERVRHGPAPPPPEEPLSPEASAREQMRHKLRTSEGKRLYARRKVLPEPVFGQIKEARGFRQFLLRGLLKVRGEWALLCLVHNLLKLWRAALPA